MCAPNASVSDNSFAVLQKLNPNLKSDDVIKVKVSRYKHAQPICEPGFLGKLPPINPAVEGLYIADTSYYYPEDRGFSESIRFGKMMANNIKNN